MKKGDMLNLCISKCGYRSVAGIIIIKDVVEMGIKTRAILYHDYDVSILITLSKIMHVNYLNTIINYECLIKIMMVKILGLRADFVPYVYDTF